MKIFNKHAQSLRPKAKPSAWNRSCSRLDTSSSDAEIAQNISSMSSLEFPLDSLLISSGEHCSRLESQFDFYNPKTTKSESSIGG